jgi:peroxiredoxin Q/BCP
MAPFALLRVNCKAVLRHHCSLGDPFMKSHADFAAKYHVPFPLLSDADSSVSATYGVLTSHLGMHYAKRTTFLIDPQGKIAKVYVDVDPEKNSAQVMNDLAMLKAAP